VKDDRSKKDEYQKAMAAYGEAIKDFRKGRFDKAADSLREIITKFPTEREFGDRARVYIAICEERLRGPRESAPLKSFEDHCHAGVFKMNLPDNEEALKLFEKAAKMKPEAAIPHFLTAAVLVRLGRTEEAVEALTKAIKLDKFYKILAQNETDFEPIWEDKKFKILTRMS
jgi:tetratricopeptide (TPR) repeat protein